MGQKWFAKKNILSFLVVFMAYLGSEGKSEVILNHMKDSRSCKICHNTPDYRDLILQTGRKVSRDEIPVLCGQCHGLVYRDWTRGVHGKVSGTWKTGLGEKWVCLKCHDPHSPKFKLMRAVAPPKSPKRRIPKGESSGEN